MPTREDLLADLGSLEAQRGAALLTVNAVTGAIHYVRQKLAELDAAGIAPVSHSAPVPPTSPS